MIPLPKPLRELAHSLNRWPGVGPRSAERLALFLARQESGFIEDWTRLLKESTEGVALCERCGALVEKGPCAYCDDSHRDRSIICVVEEVEDVFALERSRAFRGLYHVLEGRISPVNGIEAEDLRIDALARRLEGTEVQELALALGSDVEGEATSHYLANRFHSPTLRVSRLAQGLPAGSGLNNADEVTLSQAFKDRRTIDSGR